MNLVQISAEITIKQSELIWSLVIRPAISVWQRRLLLLWIICWTACGIWIMSHYRWAQSENEKLFLIVYLSFWLYFEWSITRVYLWKRFGNERLWIKNGRLFYSQKLLKPGRISSWPLNTLGECEAIEYKNHGFNESISQSFWMMGHPRIQISVPGRTLRLGYQLKPNDVSSVIKQYRAAFKSHNKEIGRAHV